LKCFGQSTQRPPLYLELAGIQVQATDLPALRELPLCGLNLSDTAIDDGWVPELPANLATLRLARTNLGEAGVKHLTRYQSTLHWLDLSGNKLSDAIVRPVGELTNLDTLMLADPKSVVPNSKITLTYRSLQAFGTNLHRLTWIDLSGAAIGDEDLQAFLSKNAELTHVILARTPITGNLDWGTYAKNLTRLDLSESLVNSCGLTQIAKLPKLKSLWLQSTEVDNKTLVNSLKDRKTTYQLALALFGTKVTAAGERDLYIKHPTTVSALNPLTPLDQGPSGIKVFSERVPAFQKK
jgi:uncharacterized protein YjbI with pentapeptide repeats